MLAPIFSLQDDFPPVTYEQWRTLAEADLKGATFEQKLVTHTYEGIDVQPLYSRRDQLDAADAIGFPGAPPFVRGPSPQGAVQTGWDLRQEHAHPDLAVTNPAILQDLSGGATSLLLRLDKSARDGLDPDNPLAAASTEGDGLMAYSTADLDAALSKVKLQVVGVTLESGAAFLPAAAALVALWGQRKIPLVQARGAFNADPFAVLASEGQLPMYPATALTLLGDLARWTAENCPQVTAVGVDTDVYHAAGATAVQDIAFGIATAVEYLRAMTAAGLDVNAAAGQVQFNISLGTHHFLAICKLRAARRLWSRVVQECGGSPAAGAMRIHTRISQRVLTRRDPYVNLLRNTVSVFAAGLGGAESVTSVPFNSPLGPADEFSRRIARNTLLVLQEEAHLNRVVDPAGGSWFLDRLTQQVAEKAWGIFQQIERTGGMLQALKSGWIAEQIASAFAPRAKAIARRKEGITGVSEFPDVREERVAQRVPDVDALRKGAIQRVTQARRDSPRLAALSTTTHRTAAAVAAATDGATIGQMAKALGFHRESIELPPLELNRFAEPFEELRDASDAWAALHGRRPAVFLANMGPVSHFNARATYAKNFFEAGGFEVIANDGFRDASVAEHAYAQSSAPIAVICSSDKLYPDLVPQLAGKLKASGAKLVVLAGNPGTNEQAWQAAGVDRFIYIKCDVLATLRDILRELGVLAG